MSPETLLRQFEVMADASNGVQKLRELILQLAVRGKLVPQDPSDEPASMLLERIAVEKERLVREAKIRKPKPLLPVGEDEVPFGVPEGWEWVRFADVIELVSGQHLVAAEYNDHGEGLPYLTGPADFGTVSPTPTRWTSERRAIAREGDILLTVKGAGIGKTNILDCEEAAISRQLMAIRPLMIERRFAGLIAASATEQFRAEQVGIAIPGIGRDDVLQLKIPLPPLPEQRRIVSKVEELMALCDELEARQQRRTEARARLNRSALHHLTAATDDEEFAAHWQRLQENFHLLYDTPETVAELRQAVLQLAVRGKLVPHDPDDEPASVLLERIAAEKERLVKEGKIRKPKPLPPIDEDEVQLPAPAGWEWIRFGDATEVASGVTKGRKLSGRKTAEFPYLRVANVQRGRLDLSVMKQIEIGVDELERYQLSAGDLLMTEGGDWDKLGRAAIWREQIPVCVHQNHIFRARSHVSGLLPEWFELLANSPDGKAYFQSAAKQTTNLASINMTQLRNWPVPLPPLPEQRRIVAKVDELMALCDQLEARLTAAREKSTHLAASVVHHLAAA